MPAETMQPAEKQRRRLAQQLLLVREADAKNILVPEQRLLRHPARDAALGGGPLLLHCISGKVVVCRHGNESSSCPVGRQKPLKSKMELVVLLSIVSCP